MKVEIYETKNYGQSAIYATGPLSEPIKQLTGRKTLLPADIRALQALGIEFVQIPQPGRIADLLGGAK